MLENITRRRISRSELRQLPVGNFFTRGDREQGESNERHGFFSKKVIQETALLALKNAHKEGNSPTRAILLGTSTCTDIPLPWIANRFDETTIVDIDKWSVTTGFKQLSPTLRRKVNVVVTDLTGVGEDFKSALDTAKRQSSSGFDFLQRGNALFSEVSVEGCAPDLGKDYDFVCSHLVASQLINDPITRFDEIIADYGFQLPQRPRKIFGFRDRLQSAHLDLLSDLASSSGIIHFADTESSFPMAMMAPNLSELVSERFEGVPDRPIAIWQWKYSDKTTYSVFAAALRKRISK